MNEDERGPKSGGIIPSSLDDSVSVYGGLPAHLAGSSVDHRVSVERPTYVHVSCFDIPIVFSGEEIRREARSTGSDKFGFFSVNELQIVVDDSRPLRGQQNTLCHEIMHVIIWAYAIDFTKLYASVKSEDEREEQFVSLMDHALLSLVRENPRLIDWLRL